jgi:hypothetical protein
VEGQAGGQASRDILMEGKAGVGIDWWKDRLVEGQSGEGTVHPGRGRRLAGGATSRLVEGQAGGGTGR